MEASALIISAWSLAVAPGIMAVITAALGWALLTLAVIDARHRILPDILTLPLIPFGLLVAWISPGADLAAHFVGALIVGAMLWSFAFLYALLRGVDGLGMGDVKLMTAAGAWLGWAGAPSALLIAAATALVWLLAKRRVGYDEPMTLQSEAPFGPFIGLGIWLTWLYGPIG